MTAKKAIQNTIDYMEDHIREEIGVEELSALANLSPFYYQRLFSRLVKKPLMEYRKLRRLSLATELLKDPERKILDIALDCGFGSHEGFTRAFKQAYGLTPEGYRKDPVHLNQFDKPDLLLTDRLAPLGETVVSDGMVLEVQKRHLEEPMCFLGITGVIPIEGQMPLGEATGIDEPGAVWERFHQEKGKLPRTPGAREIGVSYLGDVPEGHFIYLAGAQVSAGVMVEGFVPWVLPVRDYLVCCFEAETWEELVTVAINKAVKYTMAFLEEKGYRMEDYSPEVYYPGEDRAYMELWMPYLED